jgi:predicted MFS family arabinose efflux permease
MAVHRLADRRFFPARERAAVFGLILTGELVGAGVGFFISGEISSLVGWRWAFYFWGMPSLALVWVMWRYLEEPARGGQSCLLPDEDDAGGASRPQLDEGSGNEEGAGSRSVRRAVQRAEVPPRPGLVLHEDPTGWSWWRTMRYLLRIPSYGLLIAASTCVYFFFAGVRSFSMIYFTGHYHLSRDVVSALVFFLGGGAVAGLTIGARASRRLLRRGVINARIIVPAIALFVSVPLLGVGFWTDRVWLGLILLTTGSAAMASAMAPIDAARLDIVHPLMWGRGEAGRMAVRSLFEGGAPLVFGAVSMSLGGGDNGLMWTFLLTLIPLCLAGVFVIPGGRSYPRDVATVAASVDATKTAAPRRPR